MTDLSIWQKICEPFEIFVFLSSRIGLLLLYNRKYTPEKCGGLVLKVIFAIESDPRGRIYLELEKSP